MIEHFMRHIGVSCESSGLLLFVHGKINVFSRDDGNDCNRDYITRISNRVHSKKYAHNLC